ncbi:MAG: hypothetical protein J6B67_05155 [Oscillospiraceae bacterium]|nr:hypothetical protein [Oscillospiraceae bacterium]
MSSFFNQIKNLTANAPKVVYASPSEINSLCQKSERYIQNMVEDVKAQILRQAQSGRVSYVTRPVTNMFTGNVSRKETKPHYRGGVCINFRINVFRSILECRREEHNGESGFEIRTVYDINDYAVLEYMVKRVVQILEKDKIYLMCNQSSGSKDTVASLLARNRIKERFMEAKKHGKDYFCSLGLAFSMYM